MHQEPNHWFRNYGSCAVEVPIRSSSLRRHSRKVGHVITGCNRFNLFGAISPYKWRNLLCNNENNLLSLLRVLTLSMVLWPRWFANAYFVTYHALAKISRTQSSPSCLKLLGTSTHLAEQWHITQHRLYISRITVYKQRRAPKSLFFCAFTLCIKLRYLLLC